MSSPHTTDHDDEPPTAKQKRYLATLAERTGQSFTPPRTKAAASDEIERMLSLPATTTHERAIERSEHARLKLPTDGTAVRDHEVSGHGSSAEWTHVPAGTAARAADRHRRKPARPGNRRELGRYQLPDGTERILWGERIDGRVAVSDVPAGTTGRVYLIERHLESQAALDSLVATYIAETLERGEPAILVPGAAFADTALE